MNSISRGIRNTFRNTIRTFSITIILGLSIGLALTMLTARRAVDTKIASVKSSIGNTVTISPAGARGFEGGGEPLTSDQINKIKSVSNVASVTSSLQDRLTTGTNTNLQSAIEAGSLGRRHNQAGGVPSEGGGDHAGGVVGGTAANFTPPIIAVGTTDPTKLQDFGGGAITIKSGQAFDGNSNEDVAMIGSGLATKNNLAVGSTFQAYGSNLTVKAIFDSGNRFSNGMIIVPLATLQRLSQQPNAVTSATAQINSIANIDPAVASIKATLGESADVVSQQDTSNQAVAPLENIKSISTMSLIGALAAGAAIILLSMLMIVRERRREIGVFKAIGSSNFKILTQFVSEAVTFTLLAAVTGLVIGAAGAGPITRILAASGTAGGGQGGGHGGGFGGGFNRIAEVSGLRDIQASVGWDLLLYGLLAALLIAIIGSAIPAWFISKVRPAEVMRAE